MLGLIALLVARPLAAAVARNVGNVLWARALLQEHDPAASAPWFQTALAFTGEDDRSRLRLAQLLAHRGELSAARQLLPATAPAFQSDLWFFAGEWARATGDEAALLAAWQRVPTVSVWLLREGDRQAAAGDGQAAAASYNLAGRIHPGSAFVWRRLGVFLTTRDPARAVAAFAEADRLGAGDWDDYFFVEYAHALQIAGRLAEAVQLLDRQGSDAPLADAIRAEAARNAGDLARARQLYERAHVQAPNDVWFLHGLASTSLQLGDRPRAIASWQAALRLDPTFAPARDNLAALGVAP